MGGRRAEFSERVREQGEPAAAVTACAAAEGVVRQHRQHESNSPPIQIYYDNFPYIFSEEIENMIAMAKHF